MRITMLLHKNSWFKHSDAVNFMPVLLKYASAENIKFKDKIDDDGDILFALHYPSIIDERLFKHHNANIVIHAADLPKGRGRSPIHWEVEAGANKLILSMFEMRGGADDGPVYMKSQMSLDGTELLNEIRRKVIKAELDMVDEFLSRWPCLPEEQTGEPSYYKKRTRENQRIDPNKTIADQFNKMRVADNDLYPLWFELNGVTYELRISDTRQRKPLFFREISPEPPLESVG